MPGMSDTRFRHRECWSAASPPRCPRPCVREAKDRELAAVG